jgi:hypothetical protein
MSHTDSRELADYAAELASDYPGPRIIAIYPWDHDGNRHIEDYDFLLLKDALTRLDKSIELRLCRIQGQWLPGATGP